MRHGSFKLIGGIVALAWLSILGVGASKLLRYDGSAGAAAKAPKSWPADATIVRDRDLPTLVMLIHPQCPCSRASVGELARLMAHCSGKVHAVALFVHPDGAPEGWEQSGLWRDAEAIPGVTVLADNNGRESKRLGAATSGQTMLYGVDGRLLFSGGITESRGHSGDNAGEDSIEAMVSGEGGRNSTPVYGCPLFETPAPKEGSSACRQ